MSSPSLQRSISIGGIGFCLASVLVFATVAFGERWMYRSLGLSGAYVTWTILFIVLGGGVFTPLVSGGKWRFPRFYILFAASFFLYAVGWVAAYFILRGTTGEWVGSLAGSVLMALVFAMGFGAFRSFLKLAAILFVANSIGYFLGSWLNDTVKGAPGMLLWGVAFGLFLGAGIGAVLSLTQRRQ
jgi:hypothetical protein